MFEVIYNTLLPKQGESGMYVDCNHAFLLENRILLSNFSVGTTLELHFFYFYFHPLQQRIQLKINYTI